MTLDYTILYVPDVERTGTFYEEAFDLQRPFIHQSADYAEMETGDTTLAFAGHDLAGSNFERSYRELRPEEPPAGFEIALVTDDVSEAFQRAVEARATELAEPTEKPWGQVVAYVRDLNGVIVELASAMSAEWRGHHSLQLLPTTRCPSAWLPGSSLFMAVSPRYPVTGHW